jgi:hypothetical protein
MWYTCVYVHIVILRYIHDMYVPHECVMYMQVQEGVQLIVCHIIHVHVGGVVYEASYYI